jgi:hypothetical protein
MIIYFRCVRVHYFVILCLNVSQMYCVMGGKVSWAFALGVCRSINNVRLRLRHKTPSVSEAQLNSMEIK